MITLSRILKSITRLLGFIAFNPACAGEQIVQVLESTAFLPPCKLAKKERQFIHILQGGTISSQLNVENIN